MSELRGPGFLTNTADTTVAEGIRQLLGQANSINGAADLAISTAYFSPSGFHAVADALQNSGKVRILLGPEQIPPTRVRKLNSNHNPNRRLDYLISDGLKAHTEQMQIDRDLLGFNIQAHRDVTNFVDWLKSGQVEVRRFEKGFLHGRALILENQDGIIGGSSNFTFGGLTHNTELNLGQYQPDTTTQAKQWFEGLWSQAKRFDLAGFYDQIFAAYDPHLIFLRMLYEHYSAEFAEEAHFEGLIKPTEFQKHGITRAKRIMEKFNGVVIADGVGLGKSFIAGSIIEEAIKKNRQRVLLIAPAALRDGMWRKFLLKKKLGDCQVISFEELSQDFQIVEQDNSRKGKRKGSQNLRHQLEDYSMIVIDEGHAYRNTNTRRSEALRILLRGTPAKRVMFLTATPVNNSLMDLYQLLSYFIHEDGAFAGKGVRSLKRHFLEAMGQNPEDLSPDHLFDIIDEIAVRRTRHFVKKYFENETIFDEDGNTVQIRFPRPIAKKVEYRFNELDQFFDRLNYALGGDVEDDASEPIGGESPETDEDVTSSIAKHHETETKFKGFPRLTLARYNASRYKYDNQAQAQLNQNMNQEERTQLAREITLDGLLRSNLLKRFESSVHAFSKTCAKMIESNKQFLTFLENGRLVNSREIDDWVSTDNDDIDEFISTLDVSDEDLSVYDVERFKAEVLSDIRTLEDFRFETQSILAQDDAKLQALVAELKQILRDANAEGKSREERRDKRKVIIFSFFADTVHWIYEFLNKAINEDDDLKEYRDEDGGLDKNRITWITGDAGNRQRLVNNFAPVSTETNADDLYDIMITTDVLAEGVNLQQARHAINYDLPWNPMRLVQRNGRIDRIGSKHDKVFVRCFFPDSNVEEMLNLIDVLHRKIHHAAVSVGVEEEILPGSKVNLQDYTDFVKDRRERIGKYAAEDASDLESGGETNTFSGEEYRQELRQGLNDLGEDAITEIPWGAGSGIYREGHEEGFVFCARVGDDPEPKYRYISASDPDAEPNADNLFCFSKAHVEKDTPRVLTDEMLEGAFPAWERARADILEWWGKHTDPAFMQPNIPKAIRDAVMILRDPRSELSSEGLHNMIDILEAPYENRIVRHIRKLVDAHRDDPKQFAFEINALIKNEGLIRSEPASAFPLIDKDDVNLICWMAITGKPENRPPQTAKATADTGTDTTEPMGKTSAEPASSNGDVGGISTADKELHRS